MLNSFVGHQDVEIIPERLGELGLIVEQIHDPQVGRERGGVILKDGPRNSAAGRRRPYALDAGMKIFGRRANRLGCHQRVARSARFAAPRGRQLSGWRRNCAGGGRITAVTRALCEDSAACGHSDGRGNDNMLRSAHPYPVSTRPHKLPVPRFHFRSVNGLLASHALGPSPASVLSARRQFTTQHHT